MLQRLSLLAAWVYRRLAAGTGGAQKAQDVAREARRAELLRQAERYAREGLHGLAGHLRQQAAALPQ
jgi:hypothetical protein